jgi:hypothetical protein
MANNIIVYRKNQITNADLVAGSCNCFLSHAMAGETLAADTFDFRVRSKTGLGKVDADFVTADDEIFMTADNLQFRCFVEKDLTDFVAGDTVEYIRDGKLIGKFYLQNVKRVGKSYDFTCISAIGILEQTWHYGGIYTGQTVAEVAAEILEGLPYEIDPIVGDIKLYGWLPIDKKRNNLQQITIATASAVRLKPDGTLLLTALSNDIKGTVGAGRMAIGGNVAVDTPYSAVQVSEHYYQEIDDEIVLFSESSVKTESLEFTEPVHDLTVTGGTLIEWGANYAIVECNGFTEVKAKKYLHTTRTVTIGTVEGLPSDKIYTVNDVTLINSLNSSGVAQKLYEAYTKPTTIQASVFWGNERAGDVVKVINPHTQELEDAFLKKQDLSISNLLLANSDFIVDFTPSGAVTGYKNRVLLTAGSSWQVPAGVTEIRAVLIGGGDGGQAGFNGVEGGEGSQMPITKTQVYPETYFHNEMESWNGDGGDGGAGGQGGDGGKVFDTGAIAVTPGTPINLSIGQSGKGGASNGAEGTTGNATTFLGYSSADGESKPNGYVDILTGDVFALPGIAGFDGAKGRGKNNLGEYNNSLMPVEFSAVGWETKIRYCPVMGTTLRWRVGWDSSVERATYAISGSGGGASYSADGGQGSDGYFSNGVHGGDGGPGADGGPSKDAVVYGGGGYGGHGGGGGGGGGGAIQPRVPNWPYQTFGAGGPGGKGGAGGDGKQGCIIIYY